MLCLHFFLRKMRRKIELIKVTQLLLGKFKLREKNDEDKRHTKSTTESVLSILLLSILFSITWYRIKEKDAGNKSRLRQWCHHELPWIPFPPSRQPYLRWRQSHLKRAKKRCVSEQRLMGDGMILYCYIDKIQRVLYCRKGWFNIPGRSSSYFSLPLTVRMVIYILFYHTYAAGKYRFV